MAAAEHLNTRSLRPFIPTGPSRSQNAFHRYCHHSGRPLVSCGRDEREAIACATSFIGQGMRDILVTEPTGRVLDDADYSRLLNEHANADRGGRKGVEPVSDACDAGRNQASDRGV